MAEKYVKSSKELFNDLADWNTFLEYECPEVYKDEDDEPSLPSLEP